MTEQDFQNLRSGDVILIRSKRGIYKRTVVTGPSDFEPKHKGIVVPIRNRSWTGRCYTVLNWNDIRYKLVGVQKARADLLVNKDEIYRLLNWCDQPSKLISRELKERNRSCGALKQEHIVRRVIKTHVALKEVGL